MAQHPEEKQGFLGSLEDKSKSELMDLLTRQEKLLKNKKFLHTLPDRGARIEQLAQQLRQLITSRDQLDAAAVLMEGLSVADEDAEMADASAVKLDQKDVAVIARTNARSVGVKMERPFHPHRTLRSTLANVPEDESTEPEMVTLPVAVASADLSGVQTLITKARNATMDELQRYESQCDHLNLPICRSIQLDPNVQHSIVVFHTLTNRSGENGDICHIAATCGTKTFSQYLLPSYISTQISKQFGLKIEYRKGIRVLTQNGEDMRASASQIVLKDFLKFLEDSKTSGSLVLLSAGQTNTLLFNLKTNKIPAPEIVYADCAKLVQNRPVSTRRFVDFICETLDSDVLNRTDNYDLPNAEMRLESTIAVQQRLNSLRGKLFDFSLKEREVIPQKLARIIAESGLRYEDLDTLFTTSEQALVTVLVAKKSDARPRVTDDPRYVQALVHYFRNKHRSQKFDAVLLESGRPEDRGSKMVPLEESLQLMHVQKQRMQKIQLEQAKQRLAKTTNVKLSKFDPEATKSSLRYREPEEEKSEEEGEGDSEAEQEGYPD